MMKDYSLRRKRDDFLAWVERWCTERVSLDGVRHLLTRDREAKRFVEEVMPIYFYVKREYHDAVIEIELTGETGTPDAKVFRENGECLEGIEVASAFDTDDHLIRAKLAKGLRLSEWYTDLLSRSVPAYVEVIRKILEKKGIARHEENTTLLVMLNTDLIQEEEQFTAITGEVRKVVPPHRYRRLVLMDHGGRYFASLL